ncbi:hypothetical protein [Runella slithyformis]|uniref:Uncharacterized protein n=1 Tax=Runella slithyformis (strain ATCC 29530 / DSM 19594 / LMG 11500 / NCIMB 11436 / LSU 4) TaxID=761193 RepID=A0A7U3ZLX7_RUNSL|nr:hypothetical protein [Runella slithyformis]AEI49645.1 hypothetical protein Runsl_3270 [Runella slithyformis DSM 19594]
MYHYVKKIDKLENKEEHWYALARPSINSKLNRISVFNKIGDEIFSFSAEDAQELFKKECTIDDFELTGNKLYLLLGKLQKILVFDKSLKMLTDFNIPFVAARFERINTGWIFYKTLNPNNSEEQKYFYHLIKTNEDFDFIKGFWAFQIQVGERVYFDMNEPFGSLKNSVSFTACFNDTIYSVQENGLQFEKLLKFKSDMIRLSEYKDIHQVSKILFDKENPKPFGVSGFCETDNDVFFQVGQNASTVTYLENKTKNKKSYFKFVKSQLGILPAPLDLTSDGLYGVIDEESLGKLPEELISVLNNNIYEKVVEANSVFVYYYYH